MFNIEKAVILRVQKRYRCPPELGIFFLYCFDLFTFSFPAGESTLAKHAAVYNKEGGLDKWASSKRGSEGYSC